MKIAFVRRVLLGFVLKFSFRSVIIHTDQKDLIIKPSIASCHSRESGKPEVFIKVNLGLVIYSKIKDEA